MPKQSSRPGGWLIARTSSSGAGIASSFGPNTSRTRRNRERRTAIAAATTAADAASGGATAQRTASRVQDFSGIIEAEVNPHRLALVTPTIQHHAFTVGRHVIDGKGSRRRIRQFGPPVGFQCRASGQALCSVARAFERRSLIIEVQKRADTAAPAGVQPIDNCRNRIGLASGNRHLVHLNIHVSPGADLGG